MTPSPKPYFTEEYELFYLWRPEPLANHIQLAGEFKSEREMQARSIELFGKAAERRAAQ